MTVKITGMEDLDKAFSDFLIDTNKAIDEAVLETAVAVNKSAFDSIRIQSQGGRVVSRGDKTHTISKPGEAPNSDTGGLMNSIIVEHIKGTQEAFVYTDLDYGFYLETNKNRPWLEPALNDNVGVYDKAITKAVQKQIEEAGR